MNNCDYYCNFVLSENYREALLKIKKLETQDYIYTTDDGKAPEEKSAKEKQIYRDLKTKSNLNNQDILLNRAPPLGEKTNVPITATEESSVKISSNLHKKLQKKSKFSISIIVFSLKYKKKYLCYL